MTGRKRMKNNIKIRRLEWQIDELKKSQKKVNKYPGLVSSIELSIENRRKAITYMETHGSVSWEDIKNKFGFNYHSYYNMKDITLTK